MDLRYHPGSGFVAQGLSRPHRANVRDWVVWHFTHQLNLPTIRENGKLLPSSSVTPRRSVANSDVKKRRTYSVAPDADYPSSSVREHVPFYIAARSPMLFVVTRPGTEEFRAKASDLVFLGSVVGDIIDAGLVWCFSNANASAGYTGFCRDLERIGDFVDFDLLCQEDWRKTEEDPSRPARRAAEFLVLGEVPLDLISLVVTRHEEDLAAARATLSGEGDPRRYRASAAVFYE